MEHSEVVDHAVQEASTAIMHFTASRYLAVAGYVVMLYDHITTFSDEVDLIWLKPMNAVSIFFLINRYGAPIVLAIDLYDKGGLARNLSKQFCTGWFWAESLFQGVFHALTHAMVAFRVRALWGRTNVIDWTLGTLFMLYFVATLTIAVAASVPLSDKFYFDESLHLCFVQITEWFYWVWIPALLYEAVLFAMTSVKAFQFHKKNMMMPVARILYRDGIFYFLVIAACMIFNVLAWTVFPPTLVAIAKYFGFSMVNTMGSKLVLNLRGIKKEDDVMVDPSHPTLPNFELSQIRSQRADRLSMAVTKTDPEQRKQRSVHFISSRRRKGEIESSQWFNSESQDDHTGLGSFGGVQVQVDVHVDVDTDADAESNWESKDEEMKLGSTTKAQ
ncbi:hypothetical protein FRC03_009523 [Tulasnella sp. 419]|nr:hypothetical protein FRC03_009523 [Tulasnella sp. 419]